MGIKSDTDISKTLVDELDGLRRSVANNSVAIHLSGILNQQLQTTSLMRESYFRELALYRNNYVVNAVYDIISNDIIQDNTSSEALTVYCPTDKEVEEELRKLFNKLGVVEILQAILPDLLHYGSYTLRPIVVKKKGVVGLSDDYYPNQVIAITDSKSDPLMYFIANNLNPLEDSRKANGTISDMTYLGTATNQWRKKSKLYEYKDISELLYFSIDLGYQKLLLPESDIQSIRSKVPSALEVLLPRSLKIRTPNSFVYPALDKLQEVLALDKYIVYRHLGDILTPNLVGVPLPNTTDVNQAHEIVQRYSDIINGNIDRASNILDMNATLQDLAKVQLIPIIGDRATPEAIQFGRQVGESTSNMETYQEVLSRFLTTIGIPPEYFNNEKEPKENLKTAIRYAKKIKRIAKNLIRPLEHLALLHISEKFPDKNITADQIRIQLRNNQNVDELQNLETQDLVISSIDNMRNLIESSEEIVSGTEWEIDKNLVIENIVNTLALSNSPFFGVFKKKADNLNVSPVGKALEMIREKEQAEYEQEELDREIALGGGEGELQNQEEY